jgi:hypothetical protein
MEMALRAQSPLCSRARPVLVVRPAAAAGLGQVRFDSFFVFSFCFQVRAVYGIVLISGHP